mmetsp:Transcript_123/g.267  ORF Transcript_123/g.267 Transcript_123/m.267 type:complete len:225 (-) Transcript_123:353-1027(-)
MDLHEGHLARRRGRLLPQNKLLVRPVALLHPTSPLQRLQGLGDSLQLTGARVGPGIPIRGLLFTLGGELRHEGGIVAELQALRVHVLAVALILLAELGYSGLHLSHVLDQTVEQQLPLLLGHLEGLAGGGLLGVLLLLLVLENLLHLHEQSDQIVGLEGWGVRVGVLEHLGQQRPLGLGKSHIRLVRHDGHDLLEQGPRQRPHLLLLLHRLLDGFDRPGELIQG